MSILIATDNGAMSRGHKRQHLLELATADYVSFIDDDDLVPGYHCRRVLDVIKSADPPDVIGFRLRYFVDGKMAGYSIHSYNAKNLTVPEPQRGWQRHERNPNHLNPVRREFALAAGFRKYRPDGSFNYLHFGEDGDYATRLAGLKPRPRETYIDEYLYEYLDCPQKSY